MAKAKPNFTIILKHLDLKNLELYEALRHNQEERIEFERALAYILPFWYSGTFGGEDQINLMIDFNRHVNLDWPNLDGHPELRAKVLGAIGLGHVVKHDFHYRDRTRRDDLMMDFLSNRYPDIRKEEVTLWCKKNSEATLIEMCSDWGVQEKEREELIVLYRKIIS